MHNKKIYLFLSVYFLLNYAISGSSVTTGANFLELPHNAKEYAYGHPADVFGVENIFSDPAAVLSFFDEKLPEWQSSAGVYTFFETVTYTNLALSYTLPRRWGSVSLGAIYLDYGTFENIDELGDSIGNLTLYDMCVLLNYALLLPWEASAGVNVKYIRQKIGPYTADSYAFDVSLKKAAFWGKSGLWGSVALTNAGPDIVFISEGSPLPMAFNAALNYKMRNILNYKFDLSAGPQFKYGAQDNMTYGGSIEMIYHIYKLAVFLRGSYLVNAFSDNAFALGFGMDYKISGLDVDFSGAYAPAYISGNSMYASLSVSYNLPREKLDPMPKSLEEFWLEEDKEEDKEDKENAEKKENKQ
ncbi:MAG: hypothetical protein OEZ13_08495 [Spirochaetia bacterium]|nr:hypothetical protein [Spirochaetia bacterium]